MSPAYFPVQGLTDKTVLTSRARHGRNVVVSKARTGILATVKEVVTEPMFVLLLLACIIYFGIGQIEEAITLIIALLLVAGISVYQSIRSDQALSVLRNLTQPQADVIRNGTLTTVPVEDLVVGDAVLVAEGGRLPADGIVEACTDCSIDESILTGESVAVTKTTGERVFAGTNLVAGRVWLTVSAVGVLTELGKIGRSLDAIQPEKTPLQLQISQFVIRMAWIGAGAFALVWGINYLRSGDWVTALLFGLTLAMSILPEEIPVAFSSFMALGAVRLSRMGILTKQPQTVESLGSATIICTDKTGTLTQDGMSVRYVYAALSQTLTLFPDPVVALPEGGRDVLAYAFWASETIPFDPMEKAIAAAFTEADPGAARLAYPMVHEYPLAGLPPMMTHIRQIPTGDLVVAGKGAIEHLLAVCRLEPPDIDHIRLVTRQLSNNGYRVLGVARGNFEPPGFPNSQDEFNWSFLGLIALENPPKANAKAVIQAFTEAGIQVKMITGDYPETAQAIARQVGLPGADTLLTGVEIMAMAAPELRARAGKTAVFARMFPEAKWRIVEALKQTGEIVAMTGDGVNDGPALKAAHIGVAMGRRGTELAKQAASLVLVNDDLSSMVEAIAQGRRIYQNLKKAVSYIVSIHIPIILTVAIPLLANWQWANLFSPIHIIFLELVMGPTCSIAFENEPAEVGLMQQSPRLLSATFLDWRELGRSIVQGLGIALAVLSVYYIAMQQGESISVGRTLVFTTLVLSNIWLTLVNRSFVHSVFSMILVRNWLLWLMLGFTLGLLLVTLFIPMAQPLFGFAPISASAFAWCLVAALTGVGWIEGFKLIRSYF